MTTPTAKTKKRGRPAKVTASPYSLTLTIAGNTIHGEGSSMLDALMALKRPDKITNKGVLVVTKGERMREHSLTIFRAKRLFFPIAKKVIAKELEYGL